MAIRIYADNRPAWDSLAFELPMYSVPVETRVSIKVYDILGRAVKTIVDSRQTPGSYRASFDGSGLSSGIYFYRLTADNYSEVKRMVLVK